MKMEQCPDEGPGCRIHVTGHRVQVARYRVRDTSYRVQGRAVLYQMYNVRRETILKPVT